MECCPIEDAERGTCEKDPRHCGHARIDAACGMRIHLVRSPRTSAVTFAVR